MLSLWYSIMISQCTPRAALFANHEDILTSPPATAGAVLVSPFAVRPLVKLRADRLASMKRLSVSKMSSSVTSCRPATCASTAAGASSCNAYLVRRGKIINACTSRREKLS